MFKKYWMADNHLILLPQLERGKYETIGYNWFNLYTGEYNSCITFMTEETALKCYENVYDLKQVRFRPMIDLEFTDKDFEL